MKKENRILKYAEFREIIDGTPTLKSEHFSIHYRANEQGKARIGINVSKRNGIAVVRNKIKRQVREMVYSAIKMDRPLDIVISVKPSYDTNEFDENKEELALALAKIGETH